MKIKKAYVLLSNVYMYVRMYCLDFTHTDHHRHNTRNSEANSGKIVISGVQLSAVITWTRVCVRGDNYTKQHLPWAVTSAIWQSARLPLVTRSHVVLHDPQSSNISFYYMNI